MNRANRTLIVVAIALVAASIGSFGVYKAVQRIPYRAVEAPTTQAVVAATYIPTGTLVTNAHLKVVPWPSRAAVPGSFSSPDKIVNRGAMRSISENEPITEQMLAPVGAGAGLSPTIPPGMRAVSVKVNEVIGVAGFVVPGSRVDVLVTVDEPGAQHNASISRAVVGNVEVLTAGTRYDQEKAQADGKPIPTTVVTLLATPEDAERITLASTQGKVMLTLRNPLDTAPTQTQGVRMAALTGAPAPPPVERVVRGKKVMVQAPPAPAPEPPKPYTVEAIRAAKRSEEVIK
jgi:pilus assembly protein CpaB